jgi:hypothetical protein
VSSAIRAARASRLPGNDLERALSPADPTVLDLQDDVAGGDEAAVVGHVELADDVAFRLAPLTDRDAAELIDSGRLARILRGYRGRPPADRGALADVLLRVSSLVEALPEVVEMDLNPILVLPSSRGALVADARIRVTPSGATPRPDPSVEEPCAWA